MVHLQVFTFNPFAENTYIIYDDAGHAFIIDPGCADAKEFQQLKSFIETKKLNPVAILNTHCHIDHVLGNFQIKDYFKIPLWIPAGEKEVFASVKIYAPNYGFYQYTEASVDSFLQKNQLIEKGEIKIECLFVPGHSPGHLAFYLPNENFVINGDVLFNGSIGRTDLPGGDFDTLMKSIFEVMYALPDDTIVYTGHGPETTIGKEKISNPFCALNR